MTRYAVCPENGAVRGAAGKAGEAREGRVARCPPLGNRLPTPRRPHPMQRTITITAPSAIAGPLAERLQALDDVLGLNVHPGAARKPAGDVLVVHVLNRGADEVLRLAQGALQG